MGSGIRRVRVAPLQPPPRTCGGDGRRRSSQNRPTPRHEGSSVGSMEKLNSLTLSLLPCASSEGIRERLNSRPSAAILVKGTQW